MTDDLAFSSVAPSAVVHFARCWDCQTSQHPGGWHPWADSTDVEHAAATGQPDPSGQKCGCQCVDGPVRDIDDDPDPDDPDSLWDTACPICGAQAECGRDSEDLPYIHTYTDDDFDFEPRERRRAINTVPVGEHL